MTAAALWSAFGGGGRILGTNRLGVEAVARVAVGFTIVSVLWGWLWYGIRSLLLAKFVGLSKDERRIGLPLADGRHVRPRAPSSPGTPSAGSASST